MYHGIYKGTVKDIDDPKKLRRVKLEIKTLGISTSASSSNRSGASEMLTVWAKPENYGDTEYIPEVGDVLNVRFENGDLAYPYYTGYAAKDTSDNFKANYKPTYRRYEDKNGNVVEMSEDGITVSDVNENTFTFGENGIELNGNSKSFVTFAELDSALQSLVTALSAHTHPTPAGVSSAPTTPFSLDISASETSSIKTGG